jgi:hypothetical protein
MRALEIWDWIQPASLQFSTVYPVTDIDIDADDAAADAEVTKRNNKRRRGRYPLSPPRSACSAMADSVPPSKRLRVAQMPEGSLAGTGADEDRGAIVDAELGDLEATPRPARVFQSPGPLWHRESPNLSGRSESGASDTSGQSGKSGKSSPRKRLFAMEAASEPMARHKLALSNPNLPEAVKLFAQELHRGRLGNKLLAGGLKDAINDYLARTSPGLELPDSIFVDGPTTTTTPTIQPAPPVESVLAIVEDAERADEMGYVEAAWNDTVHFPLLRLALHGALHSSRRGALVDVVNCTAARIMKEYRDDEVRDTKVDYAMFIAATSMSTNTDMRDASRDIRRVRLRLPMQSINHTDYGPLREAPFAVAIETKRPGRPEDEAHVQVMTWQAAQWRLLRRLVQDANGGSDVLLADLPFLPAVTVHGHEWFFSAGTRDGSIDKTFWYGFSFGDTRDPMGVYRVIFGLQRLAHYSSHTFWPWFKKAVLKS